MSVLACISIKLSNIVEESLFQIAALYVHSKLHNAVMCLSNTDTFIQNFMKSKIIEEREIDNYTIITDSKKDHAIVPYGHNIMLSGIFSSFKAYDDDTLEFMRTFVYSNEDYMYSAYNSYNMIKGSNTDDDMVSIYYDDDNQDDLSYYTKALLLTNKKNVVIFSRDASRLQKVFESFSYDVKVVWDDNVWKRLILLSFFKNNIIQYNNSSFSLWAAYLSKYDSYKTIIIPNYISYMLNNNINNLNIINVSAYH
ncbi:hypothetical protein EBR96_09980 [bacterium]|nr:hypothetical protein [bacterium]